MVKEKGAWFPGWGFMRFWETSHAPKPSHWEVPETRCGNHPEELLHGVIKADFPELPSILGASPTEMRVEHRRRRG